MTNRPLATGVLVGFAAVAFGSSAFGGDSTPFHLEYVAPPSCASRAQFLAQLHLRSADLTEAPVGTAGPRFRVEVRPGQTGVDTNVEMTLLDGAYSRRLLHTNSCEEAIAAAALIVTLVLPTARRTESGVAESAPDPSSPAQPGEQSNEPGPDASAAQPVAPRRARTPVPVQLAVGGQLGVPATMLGATVGGGAFAEATLMPEDWLSPSLRIGFLAQRPSSHVTERGTAEVSLRTARLSACPLRLPARSDVFLRPCALGEIGRLRGEASNTEDGRPQAIRWSALGASARAVWRFPVVAVELETAAVFPLIRDRFVFDPAPVEEAFKVPKVEASALIGVSARWP